MVARRPVAACTQQPSARARDITRALAVGLCLTSLNACGSTRRPASVPAAATSIAARIVQGEARWGLTGKNEFVVRIVSSGTTCSGTLVAEDLVLTAHHCVSVHEGSRILAKDMQPDELTVEFGSGYFPVAEVAVRAILAPNCGYAAGAGDLAVLVLSRRLYGARKLQPALERLPHEGDEVSHLGFGRCALSNDGIYLKHRPSGKVDFVSQTAFRVNVPLCPGDSGGPVIARDTDELIGVVSAGAMDGVETSPDRVEYARLDYFRGLFANAARVAVGTPLSELPPVDCPAQH